MKRFVLPILLLMTVLILMTAATAHGECWFEPLCDPYGNCHDVRVCDSTAHVYPIIPPGQMHPDKGPISPILSLPPVGTIRCHQVRRCDSYGNCFWDRVCY
jgi:hypothetical protein